MGLFSSIGKIASVVAPFIPGPAGTALQVAGALSGGADANSASKAAAQTQMNFQQYNSDTSYQRATKDMIAAGLNPMLAYSQGGASTPSGASYSAQDIATPAAKLGNESIATNSAASLQKAQIANTNSSTELNAAQVLKSHADASLSSAQAAKISAETPERDVKSQFWKALLPTASSAKDVATGATSLDDLLKDKLGESKASSVKDMLQHPFTATTPGEQKLNRRLRNLGRDQSNF